jgi:hypothetical protein
MIGSHIKFDELLHHEIEIYLKKLNKNCIDREINLAGKNIKLRFLNSALVEHYFLAMQHLQISTGTMTYHNFTLYIFDASEFNKNTVHDLVAELFKNAYQKAGINLSNPEMTVSHYSNSGDFAYYYSAEMCFGFWIINNINSLSHWHFANPFRFFWYDFLSRQGIQVSHVAAVSNERAAVLLSGFSGAGKSTTALACFEEGLNFLGDDHCVFNINQIPKVFSLYNSLKIDEKKISQHPRLNLRVRDYIDNIQVKKAIFYLNEIKNDYREKPIKAILKLDRFSLGTTPTLHKISSREVLQSMVLSTISECPRVSPKLVIKNHWALASKVNAYCLRLSKNLSENIILIRKILDE